MRAIYVPSFSTQLKSRPTPKLEQFTVTVDTATLHHLKKVVRLRAGERIKILDGQGHSVEAVISQLLDDSLVLQDGIIQTAPPPRPWDLVVGLTQDFAEVVRMAQELGVRRIYPWNSSFAQGKDFKSKSLSSSPSSSSSSLYTSSTYTRWMRIAVSALEQSNAPWLVEINDRFCERDKDASWAALLDALNHCSQVIIAHRPTLSESLSARQILDVPSLREDQDLFCVIGPEGGIAHQEWAALKAVASSRCLALPTPILRTPTAVAACYGHLLALKNLV